MIISEHSEGKTAMNMVEMNNLQYFTVITLSDNKDQLYPLNFKDTPQDPDRSLKKKIEKTRKWLA